MFENFQELEDERNEKQEIENDNDKNKRVFDIEKIKGKKDSLQGSSYNISYEEQKNNPSNGSKSIKTQNNGSNTDSNVSTRNSTNYILLDKGRVIIKGNEIETIVPCDIETINNKISMISPRYPVKVSMFPLSLSQPHVYNPKSQSFTSKESYQFTGQGSNVEGPSVNSQTPSNMSGVNQNLNGYQPNPQFDSLLQILIQSYCLGNCEYFMDMPNTNRMNNLQSQDLRMQRTSSQVPVTMNQMLSNSISGSLNPYLCDGQLYRQNMNNSER